MSINIFTRTQTQGIMHTPSLQRESIHIGDYLLLLFRMVIAVGQKLCLSLFVHVLICLRMAIVETVSDQAYMLFPSSFTSI